MLHFLLVVEPEELSLVDNVSFPSQIPAGKYDELDR
jgi:hypothetical protein